MLEFLTVDTGTIIMTLLNTLVLFLLLRHFLFGKVNAFLESRQKEVEDTYNVAETAKASAIAMEQDYTQKLAIAREESAEIVKVATKKAQLRSDEIVFSAKDQAAELLIKASTDIEREKKRAINQMKDEISDIAMAVAGKVVGRELNAKDNERLIEEFIANIPAVGESK